MSVSVSYAMKPEIEARVRHFLLALQQSNQARHVVAVIVAGSACRGEEIWRDAQLISDIDVMLVTHHTNPYRTRALTEIINEFRKDGIDGGATPLPSLRRFRTLAFYEAQETGVVVWGNRQLDSMLPPITANDLPRWEAVRVLANRMFEHLKAASGHAEPLQAASKSYEALAEAALTYEGRYRPSYRERLAELIEDPPALLTPRSLEAAIAVLGARLEKSPTVQSTKTAEYDLLAGLQRILSLYLHAEGTVTELLALLGSREHHWRHRLYWAAVRPFHEGNPLAIDPVIALWQQAANGLLGSLSPGNAQRIVDAWKACPQILRNHDPSYATDTQVGRPHRIIQ